MAIFCRWGEVKIVANCGEHQPDYFMFPDTLMKVNWSDSLETEKEFYSWMGFLKADDGWKEIQAACLNAPRIGDGKRIILGQFENVLDAADAYRVAAEKYHGEFAKPSTRR